FGRTLLYSKAGGVWSAAKIGYLDTCITAPCGNGTLDASDRAGWGYQLGAGVEHALTDRWTLRAEYAYFDFGTTTITGTAVGGGSNGRSFNIDADLYVHSLKIGANYRF